MTIARRLDKRGRFETQDILQLLPRAAGKYQSLEPCRRSLAIEIRNFMLRHHKSAKVKFVRQFCVRNVFGMAAREKDDSRNDRGLAGGR